MKVCQACHASYDDSLALCPYCGTIPQANYPAYPAYTPQETKEPVSIGGWIGRSLIPYIPFVGGIIYLIMLFIWTGDTKKEDTFRNWAKAQLIVMAVVIVLTIIIVVAFGSVFTDLLNAMY